VPIIVHQLPVMCRLEKKEDGSIDFFYKGPDGQTKSMNAGLVLFGTGRKPIVQDMGLEVLFFYAQSSPAHVLGQLKPSSHVLPGSFTESPLQLCRRCICLQAQTIVCQAQGCSLHVDTASLCHRSKFVLTFCWPPIIKSCSCKHCHSTWVAALAGCGCGSR